MIAHTVNLTVTLEVSADGYHEKQKRIKDAVYSIRKAILNDFRNIEFISAEEQTEPEDEEEETE